jgi:hypothetical protein
VSEIKLPLSLANAMATLTDAEAWIGWDDWAVDKSSIRLDGEFTLLELRSLVLVLEAQLLEAH